ncbi:TPM domain-containing protein [Neobacillus sp. OS1-2]|uniref:TPM domain-containing protein n=1 Tax=Neobacillus sp. OS1-2 TaxID=3070680 RepID=UPI0027DF3059|nr:TPM domain-containing protein [Neobacillus sp. OS1-2]WML38225.1 TPM domain-containing protein [Neobacillus sp. OS1-2]
MSGNFVKKCSILFLFLTILLLLPLGLSVKAQDFDRNQYIYDSAGLLTTEEAAELQNLASELGNERETAFIILSLNGTDGKVLKQYVEDFYDEQAPGFDQPHGNTAILAIDMQERDVYLAGFKKAEQYLDDGRLDQIRDSITPDLSAGNYYQAFSAFLNTSYEFMSEEPSYSSDGYSGNGSGGSPEGYIAYDSEGNQENILFQWWFQLIVALIVGCTAVAIMAYRSGGRVTVNARTYMDSDKSKVVSKYDNFVNQTVTRQRKPDNPKSGGGGGITGGGHSHSGSSGKF